MNDSVFKLITKPILFGFELNEDGTYSAQSVTKEQIFAFLRHMHVAQYPIGQPILSPGEAMKQAAKYISVAKYEAVCALFLDSSNRVVGFEELGTGDINQCNVYCRQVVELCIKHRAVSILLAHNHPSGRLKFSDSDVQITKRVVAALALIEVNVLDHLLIGVSDQSDDIAAISMAVEEPIAFRC